MLHQIVTPQFQYCAFLDCLVSLQQFVYWNVCFLEIFFHQSFPHFMNFYRLKNLISNMIKSPYKSSVKRGFCNSRSANLRTWTVCIPKSAKGGKIHNLMMVDATHSGCRSHNEIPKCYILRVPDDQEAKWQYWRLVVVRRRRSDPPHPPHHQDQKDVQGLQIEGLLTSQ